MANPESRTLETEILRALYLLTRGTERPLAEEPEISAQFDPMPPDDSIDERNEWHALVRARLSGR